MKTFLTEKNNIPEGATHYLNETDTDCFAWYREDTKEVMVNGYVVSEWEDAGKDENLTDLKPIPQTKEVEWVNGDACDVWSSGEWHSGEHTFIGESKCKTKYVICYNYLTNYVEFPVESVRKPETQEDREKREREEAINEMSLIVEKGSGFAGSAYKEYCASLYDAGYRKGGE